MTSRFIASRRFIVPATLGALLLLGFSCGAKPATNSVLPNLTNQETVQPDGSKIKADGTIVRPDGTQEKPDGTIVQPDGTTIEPNGTIVAPDGTIMNGNVNTSTPPPPDKDPDGIDANLTS